MSNPAIHIRYDGERYYCVERVFGPRRPWFVEMFWSSYEVLGCDEYDIFWKDGFWGSPKLFWTIESARAAADKVAAPPRGERWQFVEEYQAGEVAK